MVAARSRGCGWPSCKQLAEIVRTGTGCRACSTPCSAWRPGWRWVAAPRSPRRHRSPGGVAALARSAGVEELLDDRQHRSGVAGGEASVEHFRPSGRQPARALTMTGGPSGYVASRLYSAEGGPSGQLLQLVDGSVGSWFMASTRPVKPSVRVTFRGPGNLFPGRAAATSRLAGSARRPHPAGRATLDGMADG